MASRRKQFATRNIVSFVCLKAMALEGRVERKDPHDLVYCIEHINGGIEAAAAAFREQMEGKHRDAVHQCIGILEKHFVTTRRQRAISRMGRPWWLTSNWRVGDAEARILRQRNVSDVVELFLKSLGLPEEDIPGSETPSPEGAP